MANPQVELHIAGFGTITLELDADKQSAMWRESMADKLTLLWKPLRVHITSGTPPAISARMTAGILLSICIWRVSFLTGIGSTVCQSVGDNASPRALVRSYRRCN